MSRLVMFIGVPVIAAGAALDGIAQEKPQPSPRERRSSQQEQRAGPFFHGPGTFH